MSDNQPTASGVSEEMLIAAMDEARITGSVSMVPRARMLRILEAALSAKPQGWNDAMDKAFQNLEEDRNGLVDALFAVRDGKRPAPPQPIPTPDEALREILATELLNHHGDGVNMENCIAYVQTGDRAASTHDKRKLDAAIAAMSRIAALSRARPEGEKK